MKFTNQICAVCTAFIITAGILFPAEALSITIQKEEELSREFMELVLKHFELIKDPLIDGYVNRVGNKIVSIVPHRYYTYHFYVIRENVYNAFAGPAGHIFINSGLLEAMESENELAGILAHEIAHVECRHISQRLERSSKIAIGTVAGVIAGALLGTGGAATAAKAVTMGSVAAGQSLSLAYSREDEMQADQIGMMYLAKSGYPGCGLLTSLEKIRSKQWFGSEQIPNYLMTHPASEDRIAYIASWIESHSENERKLSKNNPYEFRMARTKLQAMYGDETSILNTFKTQVDNSPDDPIAHYGYGLILARTGNRKDAIGHLKTALEKKAFDPHILKDLGRIYFLDGRYADALTTLQGAVSIAPDDPEGLFFLGRTQLGTERLESAISSFEKLIASHPKYSRAHYFLGESYGKKGDLGKAHYHLGIHYKEIGNVENSIFHLDRALGYTNDPDTRRKIEEMLKETGKKSEKGRKRK